MNKKEARWQVIFGHYLRETGREGFFELKQTSGKSFPFSKIEPHQLDGLLSAEKNGLVWKLSDEDRRKKPCDCLAIPPLPAYLVIKFPDAYYAIRIMDIQRLKDSGEPGITKDKAIDLAEFILMLK